MNQTPGPWIVIDEAHTGMRNGRRIVDANGSDIIWAGDDPPLITIADARLIAAAPDLLAALEQAIPLMERYAMRSHVLEPSVDSILPSMRAALAKAKGESA